MLRYTTRRPSVNTGIPTANIRQGQMCRADRPYKLVAGKFPRRVFEKFEAGGGRAWRGWAGRGRGEWQGGGFCGRSLVGRGHMTTSATNDHDIPASCKQKFVIHQ